MRVMLPHSLGREEARRRLHAGTGDLARMLPPGLAQVHAEWRDPDHLALTIGGGGQTVNATIEVLAAAVAVSVDLPPALGFFGGMIEHAIRAKGTKLLT